MRVGEGLLPCQEPLVEVLRQSSETTLHAEDGYDLRGFPDCSGEVAPGSLDALELQKRHQLLRTSPPTWRDPEDGLVHAPSHPPCCTEQNLQQTWWRSRSR